LGAGVSDGSAVIVIVVAIIATIRETDAGSRTARALSALHQLGVGGVHLVRLHIEQEPALAQDVTDVEDAGGLFVRVMKFGLGGNRRKISGLGGDWMNWRVSIAYSQTLEMRALFARILVHQDPPRRSMVTLSSILWPSSPRSRISTDPPISGLSMSSKRSRHKPAVLSRARGGHEVEVVVALLPRVPRAVFGALQAGYSGLNRCLLQLQRVQSRDVALVAEADQVKTAFADIDRSWRSPSPKRSLSPADRMAI
jgi:hypothetical protein